ncbi:MBL fold metallo-hydrolase [soil metagenome]
MDNGISIYSLASGSSANSMLIRRQGTTGLIDAGLPIRQLTASLLALGVHPSYIDFVFITHEHGDHIRSLPQLRRLGATIITSPGTARALGMSGAEYIPALAWKTRSIAGLDFTPLPVSHDAAEAMGVMISGGDATVTILTDLGCVTPNLVEPLCAAGTVVIESNHDVEMLRFGPYPHHLKQRVLSKRGHLSNADCGIAMRAVLDRSERTRRIWLAHLSETNNRPQTATATVSGLISGIPVAALPRHDTVDLMRVPEMAVVNPTAFQRRLLIDS